MWSDTIDLTGGEASLRHLFPDIPKKTTSSKHGVTKQKKIKSSSSSFKEISRHLNVPHQVRISLRSLDGDLDREILLNPEQKLFEFSRASSRPEQNMTPQADNAWISSPIVSRSHCRIYVDLPEQTVWLKDLGSTHGTYLNRRRIQNGSSHRVSHGDRICLGVAVINGAATYVPKEFEIKFQWEDRPALTSSIPTPAESPEQPPSKTFSVPNNSDSDEDSVIIAGESKKGRNGTRVLAAATSSRPKVVDLVNEVVAKPTSNVHVQIPDTVTGMSQVPVITFSDSDDDVPESLPILKASALDKASKKQRDEMQAASLSTPSPDKASCPGMASINHAKFLAEYIRTSPDYSPAYDNNAQTSQTKASMKSSQPGDVDLDNDDRALDSDFAELYEIASEDDWLPQDEDESSAGSDPNRPYGDDPEEAENELNEYPPFASESGSASAASSDASSSRASSPQPGQKRSINVPDSGSSDSEDKDAEHKARESPAHIEALQAREQEDQKAALDQLRAQVAEIHALDATDIIGMQSPPALPASFFPEIPSSARLSRHQTQGRNDTVKPERSRFVLGDDFDSSPSSASARFWRYREPAHPYVGGDELVDIEIGGPSSASHVPAALHGGFHTAPNHVDEPSQASPTKRVSIADIVNNDAEMPRSASRKRKVDSIPETGGDISSGLSVYERDDPAFFTSSDKDAEVVLDSAAQRQLKREIRAASTDPKTSGVSHDTIPDEQSFVDFMTAHSAAIMAIEGYPDPNVRAELPFDTSAEDMEPYEVEGTSVGTASSEADDALPPLKKRRLSKSTPDPAPAPATSMSSSSTTMTQRAIANTRRHRQGARFTWRSFVTGAVTGAAAVLGAAAAIVATVPVEVREEVMREW